MQPPVTLYTTPTCPDCHAIKRWLSMHGVPYTERDLTQADIADEAKRTYGVRIAPITVIGADFFSGTFDQQRPHLERLLT